MSKNSAADAIRALSEEHGKRSKIGQIRELFDEIENAQKLGVNQSKIVNALNEKGLDIDLRTLRTMLYRIKKERAEKTENKSDTPGKKSVNEQNKPRFKTEKLQKTPSNISEGFVNPLDKIMDDHKKEQEKNPRRDDVGFNPVPDLNKIYGRKE